MCLAGSAGIGFLYGLFAVGAVYFAVRALYVVTSSAWVHWLDERAWGHHLLGVAWLCVVVGVVGALFFLITRALVVLENALYVTIDGRAFWPGMALGIIGPGILLYRRLRTDRN